MKYIKLFENFEDNFKKYPNIFNLFVDAQYIKEENFATVNDLMNRSPFNDYTKPLVVGGHLYDANSDMRIKVVTKVFLPDNLTVNGNLDMNSSNVESLPNGLVVKGTLKCIGCNIKVLPEDLIVEDNLDLSYNPLRKLPTNLNIGGYIRLSSTMLKSIPNDLRVNGDLYLSNISTLKKLPRKLYVNGDLDLSRTSIIEEEISKGVIVTGKIILQNNKVISSNQRANSPIANLKPFSGSNTSGEWRGDVYVVHSYDWYPLFIYKDRKWYENGGKFSLTTSKQVNQLRPFPNMIIKNTVELRSMYNTKNSEDNMFSRFYRR